MKLFDAFKQYIVTHPKVAAYKPSSDKYDSEKLLDILKELAPDELDFTEEEKDKVVDFVEISDYFHKMADNFYSNVKSGFDDFNMKGENIVEYLIASLNREYRVVWNKMQEVMFCQPKGTYLYQDITNTRLQLPDGSMVDTRAALEASTDAINLVCNYLRFYLNDDFKNDQADPESFALNVLSLFQMADMFVTFKHTYDDILYNGGFVKIDREKQTLTFDYDSHYELKLLKVGNMMFSERMMHLNSRYRFEGKTTGFEKYITNTRIKPRVKVQNGRVALAFGQGNPKELRVFYLEMQPLRHSMSFWIWMWY